MSVGLVAAGGENNIFLNAQDITRNSFTKISKNLKLKLLKLLLNLLFKIIIKIIVGRSNCHFNC